MRLLMKVTTFDVFWDKAILPYCQKTFDELPSELVQSYHVMLNVHSTMKSKICDYYDYYRQIIHQQYFGNRKNSLMDRHKISACLIAAIIKCRPISYSMSQTPPSPLILSNYKIAFFSGLRGLCLLRISQWLSDGNMSDLADALHEQKNFTFPKTNEGHDEYSLGCIKSIALTDLQGYSFDFLAYSNILYWIERFNEENLFRLVTQSNT